jgi:ribA/ribD-fused uncharacterized protein
MQVDPFDLNGLLNVIRSGVQPEYLFFWGHTSKHADSVGKECFSQWYPAGFSIEGSTFATAEHFMMARKAQLFDDQEIYGHILAARTPEEAKHLGRKVRGFEGRRWKEACRSIVAQGNQAKFEQNPALRDFLLGTGSHVLVEASPVDRIWGIGLSGDDPRATNPELWEGSNLLGFVLMDVRRALKDMNPHRVFD